MAKPPRLRRKPDDPLVFVLDENVATGENKSFGVVNATAGARALLLRGAFSREDLAEDYRWVPKAAQNRWILLTRDERILRVPAELDALIVSGAWGVFVTAKDLTGDQLAALLATALPKIIRLVQKYDATRALVVTVGLAGKPDVKWGNRRYPPKPVRKLSLASKTHAP